MMGIPKNNSDTETSWKLAKHLYLSEEIAKTLYLQSDIVTPVSKHWDHPVFDRPSPYFGGQRKGKLYIEQVPHVPQRYSSPFLLFALQRISESALALRQYARTHNNYNPQFLEPEAHRLLALAQKAVLRQMSRNVFLKKD